MRKTLLILLSSLLLVVSACTTIPAGSVGIVVNNLGHNRGVQDYATTTGFVTYNPWTTSVLEWPVNVQTAVWTASKDEGHPTNEEITFTTKDNMVVSADVSLSYSLLPEKVPAFYVKFRTADMETFTHGFLRNITRDSFNEVASAYPVERIMGDNADFIRETRAKVQGQVDQYGIHIDQFGVIGAPRPPAQVVASINAKVQATQIAIQKQNEVAQATADALKSVAYAKGQADSAIATAEGEAKSNQIKNQSITPTILEWRRLDIEEQKLKKWNGALPSTILGNGGTPMIQLGH